MFDNITKRTKAALRKVASAEKAAPEEEKQRENRKPAAANAAPEKRYRIFIYGEWREVSAEEALRYCNREEQWHRIG
jgi:hypothetical protein